MVRGSQITVTVGLASGLFVSANPRRVALLISSPATNPVTISDQGTAVASNGLTLKAGTAPTLLHRNDVGDWICNNLQCITVTATETIGIIEVIEG